MQSIASQVFKKQNPGKIDLIKWYNWFLFNQMDFDLFVTFFPVKNDRGYLEEKFQKFKADPNRWYMDLDEVGRERLVNLAIECYAK